MASSYVSSSSAATSKKRKLNDGDSKPVKYYAVRTGKKPGVYTEWEDCKSNTFGFRGAVYKGFLTRADALAFVQGKNPADVSGPAKFYGLAVGSKPGVYTDWAECQANMVDTKGPKYRKFTTRAEAEEFVKDWKAWGKKRKAEEDAEAQLEGGVEVEDRPSAKKVKVGADKSVPSSSASKGKKGGDKVYTDGSSLGNGKVGSSAGVGVYFGPNDPRNVSEPLAGPLQTNQRAELTAIIRALETVPLFTPIEIVTDSQYSINCVTEWYKSWARRGWTKSDGGKVVNVDLVQRVRALIDERSTQGATTEFTWIKGHSGGAGNEAADRLAVAGAQRQRAGGV